MGKLIVTDQRTAFQRTSVSLDLLSTGTVFACEGLSSSSNGIYLKVHDGVVNLTNPDQTWIGPVLGRVDGFRELWATVSIWDEEPTQDEGPCRG